MVATFADVVAEVEAHLHAFTAEQEQSATLTAPITATSTAITVDDVSGCSRGFVQIDDELLYIQSVNQATLTLTVAPWGRGLQGSTAAAHVANTRVVIRPLFPRARIKQTINEVVTALYPTLFAVGTDESNVVVAVRAAYGLPANVQQILEAKVSIPGPSNYWNPLRRYRLDLKADPTVFPTGVSLDVLDRMTPGKTIKVTYATSFQPFQNDTDLITVTGLADNNRDILSFGTCARLLASLEAARSIGSSVEESMRSRVVQSGAAASASRYYQNLYEQRVKVEALRLQQLYPAHVHFTR